MLNEEIYLETIMRRTKRLSNSVNIAITMTDMALKPILRNKKHKGRFINRIPPTAIW
jgi:hypothetical protein